MDGRRGGGALAQGSVLCFGELKVNTMTPPLSFLLYRHCVRSPLRAHLFPELKIVNRKADEKVRPDLSKFSTGKLQKKRLTPFRSDAVCPYRCFLPLLRTLIVFSFILYWSLKLVYLLDPSASEWPFSSQCVLPEGWRH